jgi:hypothetical protein
MPAHGGGFQSLGLEPQRLARLGVRLDSAADFNELRDRLTYVMYGFAIFGVAALALVEQTQGSRQDAMKLIVAAVDKWLGA